MFGNNESDFLINSPETVAQAVKTYLLLFLGEWYLNVNDGTPWFQGVIGFHSQEEADQTLIQTILGIQGVQNVTNWKSSVDPTTRKYTSVSANLQTIYGQTQLEIQSAGAT